jgi:hypothetical protein
MNTTSILGCAISNTVALAALVVAMAVVGRGSVAIAQPASQFTPGPCPETPAPIPELATARCGSMHPYAFLYGGGPDDQGIDRTLAHYLPQVLDELGVRLVQ